VDTMVGCTLDVRRLFGRPTDGVTKVARRVTHG